MCSHSSCTIDVQYSQKAVYSFEKSSKSLLLRVPPPSKKIPPVEFPIPPPVMTYWKTL